MTEKMKSNNKSINFLFSCFRIKMYIRSHVMIVTPMIVSYVMLANLREN